METKLTLDNGKYEVILKDNPFRFECLRYGEKWRDLAGDKLMLAMFYEIERLSRNEQARSIPEDNGVKTNLFEMLPIVKSTPNAILVNDKFVLGIMYCTKNNNFVWTWREGRFLKDSTSVTGYKNVILSSKLLQSMDWYLKPVDVDF